ncbi:basement membrane-specific heparan sulfate proteoglycan core protein-like, partial [Stegastes partitus]|uniref:Basement membrane-specific heparan sulfate proteoglycan core protein-like n=1 Tax=Stegastes partitus TaxID=144197 RepID=A0A9Y4N044_9TELE
DVKEVQITGDRNPKMGDTLNLTCSVESFPPSFIAWTKHNHNGSLSKSSTSSTLVIPNMTAEHSGLYICEASYRRRSLFSYVNITVSSDLERNSGSSCPVLSWVVAGVSLSVNVLFIFFISCLWNSRKKVKPNQEDSTYVSLQKTDVSPEYEVITQRRCKLIRSNPTVFRIASPSSRHDVSYVKDLQITGETRVKEGESLNLNCSVESFPPSVPTWTKSTNENMQNGTEAALQNGTEAYLQDESGLSSFTISNVTVEDSGQYICTAKHLKEIVNVTVIYKRKPRITGDATVKGGGVLNLTCSAESFPPSLIMWRKLPTQDSTTSNIQLHNGTDGVLHSDTGSATLIIPNAKANDSGQYVCTAKHLDTTVAVYADVTVTWFSIVRNGSGCVVESEVLTCVCKSEGFPLPTIQWPLLRKHADYSVNTNVSNHAVSSTLILTAKNLGNEAVECFSSNDNENATESIPVQKKPSDLGGTSQKVFDVVSRLEIIIAFLSGVLFSAFFCCFAQKCYRRKQKESGHLDETLEMVTSQDDPAVSDGQAEQDDQTHAPEGAENGAVAAEKAAPEHNSGPKDVEYASINFSRLRRRSPREAARRKESTETEYAEIKREVKEERGDEGDGGEGEMLAGEKEEVVMEEEEEEEEEAEAKPREAEEEKEEEEAVYSNVKDIMDEI